MMQIREAFVRGLWRDIPSEDDVSWVENLAKHEKTDKPLGDFGPLAKKMLDHGLTPYDVARFAKLVAYEAAFSFCYFLEDPSEVEDLLPDSDGPAWGFFRCHGDQPVEQLAGLHVSILSLDPSGREMRPKQ